jgi:hypothetical protein
MDDVAVKLIHLLPLLVLAPILAGCPPFPVPPKTVMLNPTEVDGGSQYQDSQSNVCDIPLPGQGLPTYGTGPENLPGGQFWSGYEDIYHPGANPIPCNYNEQIQYRGHVTFDLSKFDAITDATLTWNVVSSEPAPPPSANTGALGFATDLGMSTGTRNDGNGNYFWDYDNDVSLPSCNQGFANPNCSLDVSTQARQWTTVQGAGLEHQNYGFILAGPLLSFPGSLPNDNNDQLTFYGGPQLTVIYDPTQNPRAPQ